MPRRTVLSAVAGKLGETVREPLVWAPVVAFAVVLSGVVVPPLLLDALSLLGHATGGVSLFAAGVVLASNRVIISGQVMLLVLLKNVVQSALAIMHLTEQRDSVNDTDRQAGAIRPARDRDRLMDRITQDFVDAFIKQRELSQLNADKQFEHFVAYTTLRRHYNGESIDTADIVVGGGDDLGIDSVAALVNGTVVTDIEGLEEYAELGGYIDVTFIFTQAKTSSSFDAGEIGDFGFGVRDFFDEKSPKLPRNDQIKSAAEIMSGIYALAKSFRPGNPVCQLYYVTTGTWNAPDACEARRQAVVEDLKATQVFRDVQYRCLGATEIQELYRSSKRAITTEFTFAKRIPAPDITAVTEAYFGYIPFSEFLTILRDDVGEIRDIFYDNVRDWAEYKVTVNDQIRETVLSSARERFLLMNNGVTIVAKELRPLPKERILIEDFSIVNGCQTSHVLFDQRDAIDDKVMIPIRLIVTTSKDVKRAITQATNSQTRVEEDQFFALTEFAEDLEDYFKSYTGDKSVYYERRGRQYDNSNIPPIRVITHRNLVRTMSAMFLEEPHTVTRSARGLREKVGKEIFVRGHKLEPYYLGGYAFYKLESLFRQTISCLF